LNFSNSKNGILKILGNKSKEVWMSLYNDKNKWVEKISVNQDDSLQHTSYDLRRLPNEQFDAIYTDEKGITWLGSSSGLYSYDKSLASTELKTYPTLIRKVFTRGDSILYYGYQAIDKENQNSNSSNEVRQPQIYELAYEYNDISFEYAAPFFIEEDKTTYKYYLEGYKDNWSNWSHETRAVFTNLWEGKYTFKVMAKNIYGSESRIAEYHFAIVPPWYRTILAYIFYVVLIICFLIIIVKLYTRNLEKEKIRLEHIVLERTAEIRKQKEDIEQKNIVLREQKEEITASIMYAQRIQKAIVPSEDMASKLLKNYFLLWKPRDIVSGDFWWLGEKNGYVVATAADCTGHGVPGAFMSMLGVSFLNEIVKQQNITDSHIILNKLRSKVKSTLGQSGKENESKDGMDMALLVIDYNNLKAQYSGAYNPLYLYRKNELTEFKADRNPIGIYIKEKESFTQNLIDLQKGDTLYIFSDGFADQFGGEKEKKYSSKQFKKLLLSIQEKTMEEQKEILNAEIENWKGKLSQIDDIIILGIRI
jgi:serine phosphatase RsbU (regulator of sigma subunit)